ncbi:MAG TPA: sigma-70 family RNA polymerase sigma factor, partial [candidate division Zixibacteria bacterium]|nr:sigma-70 family RNA polymerase sigma factor [candidate division Zixibacteria bacterium]
SYHPEREYEAKQQRISINRAVANLSERYRQVILYRHRDDKSYEEIAELLNVPVGTVKARIFRARELLKKSLREIR